MTGGVGRFVEVDNTGADVRLDVATVRSASRRNWCEMAGSHKDYNVSARSRLWRRMALGVLECDVHQSRINPH